MKWLAMLMAMAAIWVLATPQTRALFQRSRDRAGPRQGIRPISTAKRRRPRGGR